VNQPARLVLSAASLLAAAGLLAALPYIVGVSWSQVWQVVGSLHPVTLLWLTALWLAGLWVYTYVLTASLPGLTHRRGFMLNAAGSAISNLLPFGGAAGVAVSFAMCRSWGHRTGAVAVSTVVTGVWNILVKLLLPVIGIAALLAAGQVPDRDLGTAAIVGCAALLGIVAALVLALGYESVAEWIRDALLWTAARLPRRLRGPTARAAGAILRLRHTTLDVLRTGWAGLTFGMVAYVAMQGLLFAGCLWATGAHVGPAETIAVFALNRILTTAVVTPAGTGISETGTAALLIALGAPAAPAAAGTLLYMLFMHTLEIPLGGLAGAWWAYDRRPGPPPAEGKDQTKTDFAHL
jgi:uncharacterized membrane protein YbhN (UPF0104 family)